MRPSIYVGMVALAWSTVTFPYCLAEDRATSRQTFLSSSNQGKRTVASVVDEIGDAVLPTLQKRFKQAGAEYPPRDLTLLAFKEERSLEVWSKSKRGGESVRVATYRILGASGRMGPKIRQGDMQVPEGFYAITGLNPNSSYHLSLRVDYPNAEDRRIASREKRSHLGNDIFVHGDRVSAGCLAMGDAAIEEIFLLIAQVRPAAIPILISPYDLRQEMRDHSGEKDWIRDRYARLKKALAAYPQ